MSVAYTVDYLGNKTFVVVADMKHNLMLDVTRPVTKNKAVLSTNNGAGKLVNFDAELVKTVVVYKLTRITIVNGPIPL